MSRILDNESFAVQLQYWAKTRLDWLRKDGKLDYSEDEWDDILGDCYYKLWHNINKIREFSADKSYPDSVVGFVNNIVGWTLSGYEKACRTDKRVIARKEIKFDDLKQLVGAEYNNGDDSYASDPLKYLGGTKNYEDEWLSDLVVIPQLRSMFVWVGGLPFYEYYMEGAGEEPTGSYAKLVRNRMKKHWNEVQ